MKRQARGARLAATIDELRCNSEMLHLLLEDLSELPAEPLDRENAEWMLAVVEKMVDNLARQCRLEEEQEYMADVLDQFPSWYPQIEHLQQEQELLRRQLGDIRARLAGEVHRGVVGRETRRQLRDWIQGFRQHDAREGELIHDAFTLDVGAGE